MGTSIAGPTKSSDRTSGAFGSAARSRRAVAAAVALVASVLGFSSPAAAQSQPFTDVSQDAYYSEAVGALTVGGVFDGTECAEAMLCPGEPIDRKTMAVWTVRVLDGQDPAQISQTRFSDVAADSFHGPFIDRMAELGVTVGCGDGSAFCPDVTVSRAQMAVFLARAFDLDPGPDPGFSDVAPDAWYYDQVAALAASRITAGCADGTTFCPGRQTTRAQMATFLARATGLVGLPTRSLPAVRAYTAVTAGDFHTCALEGDNTIVCWGDNGNGQADAPDGQYTAVTAGYVHTCAVGANNTTVCWGANGNGQADAPDGQYTAVTAGYVHTCAVGANTDAPDGQYTAVNAGSFHTCALRADNTTVCWGANGNGQADAPDGQYTAVNAGGFHTCALGADNTITCWGANQYGQADAPDGQYTAVNAGGRHTCALGADNTITCWGANQYGQADAPDGQYTAVNAGRNHTCALGADNTIVCWGYNQDGQADAPDGQYTAVSTGGYHTCALGADNTTVCWGANQDGQADAPDGQYTAVNAGGFHTCALGADNTITCWPAVPNGVRWATGDG